MIFSAKSDVGKRRANNQDNYNITPLEEGAFLFTVCDGMGGANGGHVASRIACSVYTETIRQGYSTENPHNAALLKEAVAAANTAVFEAAVADKSLQGMGTTLVSALVTPDRRVSVVNVGDSRLYTLFDNDLKQITRDHSYVQYLVDMGQITMKDAKTASIRNIIIRSVGNEAETSPDLFSLELEPGAYLLLCSDGLTNCVSNELLSATLHAEDQEALDHCASALIALANDGGGLDNITVVLAKI